MRVVETRTRTGRWRALIVAGSLAAMSSPLIEAQGTGERERFETASIRENRNDSTARPVIKPQPSGLSVSNATALDLIKYAFDVIERDVVGELPGWAKTKKFDVAARAVDVPLTSTRVQAMTKALLQDRFKLDASYERATGPVYALVLARSDGASGPNLRRSESKCAVDPPLSADADVPVRILNLSARCGLRHMTDGSSLILLHGSRATVPQLARYLSRVGGFDRPVVDRTGLTGEFDLQAIPPADMVAPSSEARLLTAIREQLGLTLRAEEGSFDVLRIRRLEQPSPN